MGCAMAERSKTVWSRGIYSIERRSSLVGGVWYASFALMVCACCIMESDSYAEVKEYAMRDHDGGMDVVHSVGVKAMAPEVWYV